MRWWFQKATQLGWGWDPVVALLGIYRESHLWMILSSSSFEISYEYSHLQGQDWRVFFFVGRTIHRTGKWKSKESSSESRATVALTSTWVRLAQKSSTSIERGALWEMTILLIHDEWSFQSSILKQIRPSKCRRAKCCSRLGSSRKTACLPGQISHVALGQFVAASTMEHDSWFPLLSSEATRDHRMHS